MKNAQAHHILPQKLAAQFDKLGVNVNDPHWGAWVEGTPPGTHQNWSAGYNDVWGRWLRENSGATIEQIVAQAQKMAAEYGISWAW